MINKVVDGICKSLYATFEKTCDIHTESVDQGLKEPCFFIVPLNTDIKRHVNGKYFVDTLVHVHYFPKSKESNHEIHDIASRLMFVLENIEVSKNTMIRSAKMNYEINDGVLHFFITYQGWVDVKKDTDDFMEKLNIERSELKIES